MDYNELSQRLWDGYGVRLTRRTLLLHNRLALLPPPQKRHGGHARGWRVDFPEAAVYHAVANYRTMRLYGLTYDQLAEVRRRSLCGSPKCAEMEAFWGMQLVAARSGRVLPSRPQPLSDDPRGTGVEAQHEGSAVSG